MGFFTKPYTVDFCQVLSQLAQQCVTTVILNLLHSTCCQYTVFYLGSFGFIMLGSKYSDHDTSGQEHD
tara:strand:+ start:722 stop:925 length:204 start_codon:yes stop_codon:yes gene_type:complete